MTNGTLLFIFMLLTVVFIGALFAAFEYGKEVGITKYEEKKYEEDRNELPKND